MDERVVLGKTGVINVCKHISRYNLALPWCVGRNVADLACGSGYGSYLMSKVSNKVIGVDIDRQTIKKANKEFKNKNLSFICDDITKLLYKNIQTIVSFETIEHIDNINEIEEFYQSILSKDGILIFSVPINERNGFNKYHKHTFTIKTARKLFSGMNTIIEFIQKGVNFYYLDETNLNEPFSYYVSIKQK